MRYAIPASIFILTSSIAHADPCASIRDHDTRQMCRAEQTGDPGHCSSIGDEDLRRLCRARASKK